MTNRRTGAPPRIVSGTTFLCYHVGVLSYEWRSEDGRCTVNRRHRRAETFSAWVDKVKLGKRFRTMDNAMKAAVAAVAKAKP